MTQSPTSGPPGGGASVPLGVIEAARMGWRLLVSDFWRLWAIAFVLMAVWWGASTFGLPAVIIVLPPLVAGLFYAVARRIDGARPEVGDLFAGFKQRFGQSVLAFLPVAIVSMMFGVILAMVIVAAVLAGFGAVAAFEREEEIAIALVILDIVVALGILFIVSLIVKVFCLFFVFALPGVWDHPESGWAAVKASVRLVREHFFSVVGFVLLFWVLGAAAELVGLAACCIGVFFTVPLMLIWQAATLVYLYRSWTGRPLAQAAA